ncbi:hypothetical protein EON67_02030 [archaeon]|nr:MAG: hypothetical protein EON67_02030 [archaeon]
MQDTRARMLADLITWIEARSAGAPPLGDEPIFVHEYRPLGSGAQSEEGHPLNLYSHVTHRHLYEAVHPRDSPIVERVPNARSLHKPEHPLHHAHPSFSRASGSGTSTPVSPTPASQVAAEASADAGAGAGASASTVASVQGEAAAAAAAAPVSDDVAAPRAPATQ